MKESKKMYVHVYLLKLNKLKSVVWWGMGGVVVVVEFPALSNLT